MSTYEKMTLLLTIYYSKAFSECCFCLQKAKMVTAKMPLVASKHNTNQWVMSRRLRSLILYSLWSLMLTLMCCLLFTFHYKTHHVDIYNQTKIFPGSHLIAYACVPSHRAVLMVRWLKAVIMHHTSYLASVSPLYTNITFCLLCWYEATRLQFVDACLTCPVVPSVQTHTLGSPWFKQSVCDSPKQHKPMNTHTHSILLCIVSLCQHSYLILFRSTVITSTTLQSLCDCLQPSVSLYDYNQNIITSNWIAIHNTFWCSKDWDISPRTLHEQLSTTLNASLSVLASLCNLHESSSLRGIWDLGRGLLIIECSLVCFVLLKCFHLQLIHLCLQQLPDLVAQLGVLYHMIESRVKLFHKLTKLHGKLYLLMTQVGVLVYRNKHSVFAFKCSND